VRFPRVVMSRMPCGNVMCGDAPAPHSRQTFVTGSYRCGAVIPHGVRSSRRISILGDGLSYLVTIGRRLSRSIVRQQQCNSNRNQYPRHVDRFLSVSKSSKGR
jgi:hypothetical protein